MSVLTLPFELPARVVRRAADDLGAIASRASFRPGSTLSTPAPRGSRSSSTAP
jgi:hypothetical protein